MKTKNNDKCGLKNKLLAISDNEFVVWLISSFIGGTFAIALLYKDWLGVALTFYPLSLTCLQLVTGKNFSKNEKLVIVIIIDFVYLICLLIALLSGNNLGEVVNNLFPK